MRTNSKGVGGHQRPYQGQTDEWLTPPEILAALGPFDLDPCAPVNRPWDTARVHYTIQDDGLVQPWPLGDRVWLNPPYGPQTGTWLARLKAHQRGTALIFARTETKMFFEYVWRGASTLLFLEGRLHFHNSHGERAPFNAGAPSVLVAYGQLDRQRLIEANLSGQIQGQLVSL